MYRRILVKAGTFAAAATLAMGLTACGTAGSQDPAETSCISVEEQEAAVPENDTAEAGTDKTSGEDTQTVTPDESESTVPQTTEEPPADQPEEQESAAVPENPEGQEAAVPEEPAAEEAAADEQWKDTLIAGLKERRDYYGDDGVIKGFQLADLNGDQIPEGLILFYEHVVLNVVSLCNGELHDDSLGEMSTTVSGESGFTFYPDTNIIYTHYYADWSVITKDPEYYVLDGGRLVTASAPENTSSARNYLFANFTEMTDENIENKVLNWSSDTVLHVSELKNLRSEASSSSALVTTVDTSDSLYYYGETAEGTGSDNQVYVWYKIYLDNGVSGWIRADFCNY